MIKAYAKTNLLLLVKDKRDDGYHNIHSLVCPIHLYDEIYIRKNDDLILECEGIKNEDNVAYKVAKFLKETYEVKIGAYIKIKKHIPISAGLGGGSSDAASVLFGLNKLWRLGLTINALSAIGAMFGSDIPLFLQSGVKEVSGRGEEVKTVASKVNLKFLVISFKEGNSTAEVYKECSNNGTIDEIDTAIKCIKNNDMKSLIKLCTNDLSEPAIKVDKNNPSIKEVMDMVNGYILESSLIAKCMVSGSGSSLIVIAESRKTIRSIAKSLKQIGNNYLIL